ncbi:hypothetical protein [Gorillibacterium sp. sgz500922]|uniref:hypothetical protein n=1 Tax=Gorillibacterium sp. sgz500922 TaxID=3446694 RepID=UPI003F662DEB
MKRSRRRRVLRWAGGALLLLLLLVGGTGGYLWYRIHHVDLADIQARHPIAAEPGVVSPSPAGGEEAGGGPALPGKLAAPAAKAEDLAGKPIKSQDAIDFAAILVKAGLSFKEIQYLTDQSSGDLTVTEKQHIRDLLLDKLSAEEIATLQAITRPYGKNLVILDKSYPIELVGVYDPAERQRILDKLHERQAAESKGADGKDAASAGEAAGTAAGTAAGASGASAGTGSPSAASPSAKPSGSDGAAGGGTASAGGGGSSGSGTAGEKGGAKGISGDSGAPSSSASASSKAAIAAKYESKLKALQSRCQSKVAALSATAAAKFKATGELPTSLVGQIAAAEGECDASFEAIVSAAAKEYKQAGDSTAGKSQIAGWRARYESAKASAKAAALAKFQGKS